MVFVHAATGSRLVWEYQIPAFTRGRLSCDRVRQARLWPVDSRSCRSAAGYGRGRSPGARESPRHRSVPPRRHRRRRIVALDFAVSFPQRLRSLVVANSIGGVQDEDYLELGRRLRPPQFNALPPDVRELGPSYRAANPGGTARWLALERQSRPEGTPPPTQTFRNRMTFSLLESISLPTLLMTGDADLYSPPAVLRLFAARIKNAESVIVPEVGHSTYWEQPDVFNQKVLEFIRKH